MYILVPFHLTFDKLFPLVSHELELLVAEFDVKNSKIANLNKSSDLHQSLPKQITS